MKADLPSFLSVEDFATGKRRVLTELFGECILQGAAATFDVRESARNVEACLDSARDRFLAAATSENPVDSVPEMWLIQESHAGQSRPVLTVVHSRLTLFKPRPLEVEVAWAALVKWLGAAVGDPLSVPFEVRPRGEWGWVSLVDSHPVGDKAGIGRFYHRLGVLGALAWVMGSSDCTGANVVAVGEFPTLVDSEMGLVPGDDAFHPDFRTEFRRGAVAPLRVPDNFGKACTFGAAAIRGLACPHHPRSVGWVQNCPRCHHVPRFEGQYAYVDGHEQEMVQGFARALRVLLERRRDLLAPDSVLTQFEGLAGRVVVRPTAVYIMVRDWYFNQLVRSGRAPALRELLCRLPMKLRFEDGEAQGVINEECRAIRRGDVPRFQSVFSENVVRIDRKPVARSRFTALDRARARLAALNNSMLFAVTQAWASHLRAGSAGPL